MDPFLGFFALLALVAFMSGPKVEQPPEVMPLPLLTIEEQCSKESNADLEEISSADEFEFFNNHDFRCYEKCLAIKHGLVEENGDPVIDAFADKFSVENTTAFEEYIIQCSIRNQRPDICDQVYYTSTCIGKFSII